MTILVVYSQEPTFPATDQNPSAVRYHVGTYWADCLGTEPTEEDIEAFLAPPPAPRIPTLVAMGQVKTADGDITSIAISTELAGAFVFATGEIWCFFVDEQPDTEYIVLAYDANSVRAYVEDEDKYTSHFIIRCTDFVGAPMNPPTLNFEVKRVVRNG